MRLYREVPPEQGPGLYLYKHVHDFVDAKYVHALEPIEITEEEIIKTLEPRLAKPLFVGGKEWDAYVSDLAKAILSKLNETKKK